MKIPFDYFAGAVPGFNVNGQDTTKSWLGFFCTLGLFGVVIASFMTETISMMLREGLTVSIAEERISSPPPTSIKDLRFGFAVTRRNDPLVSHVHGVEFGFRAELITVKTVGTTTRTLDTSTQSMTITRCTPEDWGDLAETAASQFNLEDLYCIPRDQSEELFTIQGKMGDPVYKELYVSITCGYGLPPGSACPMGFWGVNVGLVYAASYMNTSNFEKPVTVTPTVINDFADLRTYHEKIILMSPREIITDTGLIFSSYESKSDLIITEGPCIIDGFNAIKPDVYGFRILMNTNRVVVQRSYKKLLDVLAGATGISSTIALFVVYLVKPYLEQKAQSDIMKLVCPETHRPPSFFNYFLALLGNRAAKRRVRKTEKENNWITENMDILKMVRNWAEFEKQKKKLRASTEQVIVQDAHETSMSVLVDRPASFLKRNRTKVRPTALPQD